MDVINASALLENILRCRKLPKSPPIKTAKNSGQYRKNSLRTLSLVNCPKIPEIELIRINNDALVTIFLGLSAFNKKRIGLKKIPPPIPTTPEMKPRIDPIIIEIKKLIFFITIFFSPYDLLFASNNKPAIDKTINNKT